VPAYIAADPAGQGHVGGHRRHHRRHRSGDNAAGNFFGWGVVIPLYAIAILTTGALPRWIGWLGLLVGLLAGWLRLLSPASSVISGISSIGFFVFMLSMGIALLRRRSKLDKATQASAQAPS
jgi:XapX domain-containing protein